MVKRVVSISFKKLLNAKKTYLCKFWYIICQGFVRFYRLFITPGSPSFEIQFQAFTRPGQINCKCPGSPGYMGTPPTSTISTLETLAKTPQYEYLWRYVYWGYIFPSISTNIYIKYYFALATTWLTSESFTVVQLFHPINHLTKYRIELKLDKLVKN